MTEYEHVLRLAVRGKLPKTIDSGTRPSFTIVQELIEAGHLKAIDASSHDGPAFLEPRITMTGREYLAQIRERKKEGKQLKNDGLNDRAVGLPAGVPSSNPWLEIKREFGVSKLTLAKRISFIKDEFKRDVIFRDIEQAYLLAQHGFYKPSVILAGGVIEEMFRIYLECRNVAPKTNNLDGYIKACEEQSFIKDAIHRLADSFRLFRNIVHMEREPSSKLSISKATAKGAVSSVFTIANELSS